MRKRILLGVISLVLLVGGLGAVAFASGVFKVPKVVEMTNDWGTVTQDSTHVVTSITLDNPNPIGISLGAVGLEVDIKLNGLDFGRGVVEGIDLPKGLSTTELVTRIDNAIIPQWWATHVTAGERTTVKFVPKGTVNFFGKRIALGAPSITRTIETDLLSNINTVGSEELSLGPISIVLQSRQFAWGKTTDNLTKIEGTLVIHNPNVIPIPVTKLGFTLEMNGVQVAEGATDGFTILLPRGEATISLEATITNEKLLEWWPTHINGNERTAFTIRVDAILEVDLSLLGTQRFPINLVSHQDSFETDILK